jgi:hypothetical protein
VSVAAIVRVRSSASAPVSSSTRASRTYWRAGSAGYGEVVKPPRFCISVDFSPLSTSIGVRVDAAHARCAIPFARPTLACKYATAGRPVTRA